MPNYCIGIDTGINGAAIALDEYGEMMGSLALPHFKEIACYSTKKVRSVLDVEHLESWLDSFDNIRRIVVEESPAYNQGATSAYTSGYNSGMLQAICAQRMFGRKACTFLTVAPRVWQKDLFGDILESSDEGWSKDRSIRLAQMHHGMLPIFEKPKRTSDGFADACHIAEWGRGHAIDFFGV